MSFAPVTPAYVETTGTSWEAM